MKKLLFGLTLLVSIPSFASETPTIDSFTFDMAKEFVLQNGDRYPEEKAIVETLEKIKGYIPTHSAGLMSDGSVSSKDVARRQSAKIIQLMARDYNVVPKNGTTVRQFHDLQTQVLSTFEVDPISYAAFVNKHLTLKDK